jgi:hypothetical protein
MKVQTSTTQKANHGQIARLGFLATFTTTATVVCVLGGVKDALTILGIMLIVNVFAMIGCMTLTMDAVSDIIYPPQGQSIFWSPGNRSQAFVSATVWWFFTTLALLFVALVASSFIA